MWKLEKTADVVKEEKIIENYLKCFCLLPFHVRAERRICNLCSIVDYPSNCYFVKCISDGGAGYIRIK